MFSAIIYVLYWKNTKCRKSKTILSTLKNRPNVCIALGKTQNAENQIP
jgi:hypothetical protein